MTWLMGLIAAWRARRSCFHHNHRTGETWVGRGRIIDGGRKLYDCARCGRRWIL